MWEIQGDGYAVGPAERVTAGRGSLEIVTVWTDEDGVCVQLDGGEEPIPVSAIPKVCAALLAFATLEGPPSRRP